jgi:acetyltransferase-like isoleucine patch superfamily enzyme
MIPVHLEHDWFSSALPANIQLGERTWLYSSYAFAHYQNKTSRGLSVGKDTGLYHGTFFDLGPDAQVKIGDFCSLVGVIFATNGKVEIGDYTFIAHEVVIADGAWPLPGNRGAAVEQKILQESIKIGPNVWIGAQALIIGSLRIGQGAIIGAGALVTQDVPPNSVCVGNPMRILNRDTSKLA